MAANPTPHGLSQPLGGEGGASSFGIRGRNHSSSSSLNRVRGSVESLLSRASRDNLLSSRGGQGSNAPGANATFDVVDVPTGGGSSALFVRSGGLPPPFEGILGATDGSGNTAGGPKENDANGPAPSSSATTSSEALSKPAGSAGGAGAPPSSTPAVTANVRYRNDQGRQAVLAVARSINHDFSALTSIMNVTLGSVADLDALSANEDIEWVDKNGAVFFVQPFGKS